jgi:hypothetical protein
VAEPWLQPRSARGILRLVDDDLDGARADFLAVANRAYDLGVLNTAAFSFAYLARSEYLAGAWDDAVVHAERAVAVNDEADWGFTWPAVVGIAVLVPAARGEWAAAEALLAGAAGRYPAGYERSVVAVGMSRARLAEARGDAAAAVAALEPVRSFPIRDAVDEPGFWAWQDLYAEGLVGLGRAEEADALLRPHEERAAVRGRLSSVARLARARGRWRPRSAGPSAPRSRSSGPSRRRGGSRCRSSGRRPSWPRAPSCAVRGNAAGPRSCSPPRRRRSTGWAPSRTPRVAGSSWPARDCSLRRATGGARSSRPRSSSWPASRPRDG